MNIKVRTKRLLLEVGFDERTLVFFLSFAHKKWINIERHFPKAFQCYACGEKSENEDTSLKLCDECLDDFMTAWRKKLR